MNTRATVVALATAVTILHATAALSHDEPGVRPHHINLPANPTAVMRAFSKGKLGDGLGIQNLAAVAASDCVNGLAASIYPCSNVDLAAFMPLAAIGQTQANDEANDIWGWTDPRDSREYAIIGRVFGTSFVDVTDPHAPVFVGELDTHGRFGSPWRDIKVYADHAFIVSEASRHGMQVFDLTQLGGVTNPPVVFEETAHYRGFGSAHNIVINEDSGYAYAVGTDKCSGGLEMVDIRDPLDPADAGCFASDGYTHDAQCVVYQGPDSAHEGKEICLASNEDTLTIVDVSDKSNPIQLSRTTYEGVGYTHQGWLTEDQTYFLLDDELDEQDFGHNTYTRILNVSDLDGPFMLDTFMHQTPAIDHNQYVKGNYAYQANYRAGLRILDVSNAANGELSEVGYFDIYPEDDAAEFNAAWSNYPYFESGTVVVSGIEQGLFVLRPTLGETGDAFPSVTLTAPEQGATVSGSVTITADASDDLRIDQVEFFVDGSSVGVDTVAPYTVSWDSTSVADTAYVMTATATDSAGQSSSDGNEVIVDNVPDEMLHVGDLDGQSAKASRGGAWTASVTVEVHDADEAAVAGATVSGTWSAGATGSGSCVTDQSGRCTITRTNIKKRSSSATFTVSGVTGNGLTYGGTNHDPEGDSTGTVIVVSAP